MNRLEIHHGILATGLQAAAMTLEATQHAVRELRNAAQPNTQAKADLRWASRRIDEAMDAVQRAADLLSLPLGASCAKDDLLEPDGDPTV